MSKQLSSKRAPVRIEILSSAENIPLLDKDLHEILMDASNSYELSSYVDKDGETRVDGDLNTKEIALYRQNQVTYYLTQAQRLLPILSTIIYLME